MPQTRCGAGTDATGTEQGTAAIIQAVVRLRLVLLALVYRLTADLSFFVGPSITLLACSARSP